MNPLNRLAELFSELPGVGPRQSKRLVYFLLTRNQAFLNDLSKMIIEIKGLIETCAECQRFFQKDKSGSRLCSICRDTHRDESILMIVSRDVDLENIEKTRTYVGKYFVLGGAVPILEKNPEERIRSIKLLKLVKEKNGIKEIILALNATPEGEHTGDVIERMIQQIAIDRHIKISRLGKGISTGTELEYSDGETIKNALKNRA